MLSLAAVGLKPIQEKQVELDTKKQILGAVMELSGNEDILSLYDKRTKSLVVNAKGEIVTKDEDGKDLVAEDINIGKEYKKPVDKRLLPVFMFMSEANTEQVEAYIFPTYGNGLWNNIWGFIALNPDLATIKGAAFDHVGETPGLGARITSADIQERYKGKKIFDDQGNLVSVEMVKGETGNASMYGPHKVDGMSGATLTAKGVNEMLESYFGYYQSYIDKLKKGEQQITYNQTL
jgi:Na+-transporting NADH:ubiquinone oxidoreductase subunit C